MSDPYPGWFVFLEDTPPYTSCRLPMAYTTRGRVHKLQTPPLRRPDWGALYMAADGEGIRPFFDYQMRFYSLGPTPPLTLQDEDFLSLHKRFSHAPMIPKTVFYPLLQPRLRTSA